MLSQLEGRKCLTNTFKFPGKIIKIFLGTIFSSFPERAKEISGYLVF